MALADRGAEQSWQNFKDTSYSARALDPQAEEIRKGRDWHG